MEEKRKDLINSKQKKIVNEIVAKLNESHPSFYYLSTIEVSAEIEKYISQAGNLSHEQQEIMHGLDMHDIQILLSFHEKS